MKGSVYSVPIVIIMITLAGCSPVKFYSDNGLTKNTGLKYYTVKPYIQVEKDPVNNTIVKATVIYLPDLANPQYMALRDGLGSRKVDLKLSDGTINTFGSTSDSGVSGSIEALAAMISKSADAIKDLSMLKAYPPATAPVTITEIYEVFMEPGGTRLKKIEF